MIEWKQKMIEGSKAERITINNGTVEIKSKLYITIYLTGSIGCLESGDCMMKYFMASLWKMREKRWGEPFKNQMERFSLIVLKLPITWINTNKFKTQWGNILNSELVWNFGIVLLMKRFN